MFDALFRGPRSTSELRAGLDRLLQECPDAFELALCACCFVGVAGGACILQVGYQFVDAVLEISDELLGGASHHR